MIKLLNKLFLTGKTSYFYAEKGLIALKSDNYSSAVRNYTNAIVLEDDNIEYYYQRALAYEKLNLYEKALKDLEFVHVLQSKLGDDLAAYSGNEAYVPGVTRRKSINIKEKLNNYSGAIEDVDILIDKTPDDIDLMDLKADIYAKAKDFDSALAIINLIIEKEPNNGHFYLFRGGLYKELNQLEEAEKDIKKALNSGLSEDDKKSALDYIDKINENK